MKTKNVKILVCGLFLAINSISFAQSLVVKARFLTSAEKSLTAYYTLVCNDTIVERGMESKVKLKLARNREYVLIISKIGFKSKTIRFSTYTTSDEKFNFNVEAVLQMDSAQNKHVKAGDDRNIRIYYDQDLDAFCQVTNTKNQTQY